MSEWQPIETAPKNGSVFATYTPDMGSAPDDCYDIAFWSFEHSAFVKAKCGFRFVTHYMSLSDRPKTDYRVMTNWHRRRMWEDDYEDAELRQRVPGVLGVYHPQTTRARLWRMILGG